MAETIIPSRYCRGCGMAVSEFLFDQSADRCRTCQELDIALQPPKGPSKTFVEILASGVPHRGGLAQLAVAEQLGGLWSAPQPTNEESFGESAARNAYD